MRNVLDAWCLFGMKRLRQGQTHADAALDEFACLPTAHTAKNDLKKTSVHFGRLSLVRVSLNSNVVLLQMRLFPAPCETRARLQTNPQTDS